MANAFNLNLPSISDKEQDQRKLMKQMINYVRQMADKLQYVLNNLDVDNLSSDLADKVSLSAAAADELETIQRLLASSLSGTVRENTVIKSINNSGESEKINANRVKKGYSAYESGTVYPIGLLEDGTLVVFSADITPTAPENPPVEE